MKLGLIGLPQAGKKTVFAALTGARGDKKDYSSGRGEPTIATVTVRDNRIDFLSKIYEPKKTTYAKMEYLLSGEIPDSSVSKSEGGMWSQIRTCDGLLHVVRNFRQPGGDIPMPEKDFWLLEEEIIMNDLLVIEKRLERIELDKKRGKRPEGEEYSPLKTCHDVLESGEPLRKTPELASNQVLRGFTFLSAKPVLVILNNEDEDDSLPKWDRYPEGVELTVIRSRLELDIASMSPDEVDEFREAYKIYESALDRVIRSSYQLLNRISFFTVGSDEVKAWTITEGTPALEAAGTVHSDMKKGFIRAETLSYEDLVKYESFQKAKKAGVVRLEGKDYKVRDGDIINFRFNV